MAGLPRVPIEATGTYEIQTKHVPLIASEIFHRDDSRIEGSSCFDYNREKPPVVIEGDRY